MQTIIIKKDYNKDARLVSHKNRVLFYNDRDEILVFKQERGFYIPTQINSNIETFASEIKEIVPIEFKIEDVEELLQVIYYGNMFQTDNGKLIKKYLKYIRDYYMCFVDFDSSIRKITDPLITYDGYRMNLEIMKIDDAIRKLEKIYRERSDKFEALEMLKSKIKLKRRMGDNYVR